MDLNYTLRVANIENVVAAHMHLAPAGTNGPAVAFLYGPAPACGEGVNGILPQGVIFGRPVWLASHYLH